jgi:death-on-curing protein
MSRNDLTELLLGREISIRFVSVIEAVALHDGSIKLLGGTPGLRDLALLESALHAPMKKCVDEQDVDLFSLAATLADGIAQKRAFVDGNKRTAFLSCIRFLGKNDIVFQPDVAEAIEKFCKLASHELDAQSFAEWIRCTVEAEAVK